MCIFMYVYIYKHNIYNTNPLICAFWMNIIIQSYWIIEINCSTMIFLYIIIIIIMEYRQQIVINCLRVNNMHSVCTTHNYHCKVNKYFAEVNKLNAMFWYVYYFEAWFSSGYVG